MKNLLRKTMLLFFLSFFMGIFSHAQEERDFKKLDEYIEKTREDWKVPGIGVAIIEKDKVVHAKGYGFADLENELKVTPHTLFAIGSSSKAFTAASVCLLADQGLIDLDEPVITYLSDFQLHDEYATKKMTPRDLLSHISGLPRHDLVWYGSSKGRMDLYKVLKHLEPSQSFRGAWQYQNLMYLTAGVLIEKVSGKSWESFVKENFFDPLDMKRANFSVNKMKKEADFALPYNEEDDELKKMDFRNIDAIGPAGSINASVTEMANWVKMHIAGGTFNGKEVIGQSSLKQSHRPHSIVPGNASEEFAYTNYGLGWFITSYRGHLLLHHGGNIDGFSAMVAFMPMDSVGMVILTNKNGTGATGVVREAIADFMMGNDMIDWNSKRLEQIKKAREAAKKTEDEEDVNRVEGTNPSHELSAYAGKYMHPAYGEVSIKEGDGILLMSISAGEFPLDHYHYDIFEADSPLGKLKANFVTGMDGQINAVKVPFEPALDEPISFEKVLEEIDVEKDALEKYVGEYDLMGQVVIKIYVKEDYLRMMVPGQPEYKLVPIGEHEFKLENMDGFRAKFTLRNGSDKAESLSSIQPNGTFTAQRKE